MIAPVKRTLKLAVPLFQSEVAPRFDVASRILVVSVDGNRESGREIMEFLNEPLIARVNRVIDLEPDVLICGNLDGFSGRMLSDRGIRIVPWVMGDAEGVLRLFLHGKLESGFIAGPGRCYRRWGRGRGRMRGWRHRNRW